MRLDFVPYPLLFGLALLVLALILLRRRSASYRFFFAVFGLYLLFVIQQILFFMPIPLDGLLGGEERWPVVHILERVNLLPFRYLSAGLGLRYLLFELVGNLLIGLPFGFGLPFLVRVRAWQMPFVALGFGLATELSQLAVSLLVGGAYRSTDVTDTILNTISVLAGYSLFVIFALVYRSVLGWLKLQPDGLAGFVAHVARGERPA